MKRNSDRSLGAWHQAPYELLKGGGLGLGFRVWGSGLGHIGDTMVPNITPIMENQMEKKMENEMEAGII